MYINVKQVSSLEKIRPDWTDGVDRIYKATVLKGEKYSYQIAVYAKENTEFRVDIKSDFGDKAKVYIVQNAVMDLPTYNTKEADFITVAPGIMPDILMPAELENNLIRLENSAGAVWVEVSVPENIPAGEYPIEVTLFSYNKYIREAVEIKQTMMLEVIDAGLPEQTTKYTQWFHVDCIADIHNVSVYSEEHWDLIDKYMSLAADMGVNMILTPVITPPLDTDEGITRPCTQLVKIEKVKDKYIFDFELLKRWINLCRKNNIEYYEMAHLFSQWGLKYSPNIKVTENGKEEYMFGWHVKAQSDEYKDFLNQFLPALIKFLESEGIKDKCYFHLSDEPRHEHLSAYKYAHDLVIPLLDGCPAMDAISDVEFYDKGLIQTPVTVSSNIDKFLPKKIKNQWVYYCSSNYVDVGNRFLSMASYRNRILGLQMYKYGIEGFLQWGYNFYYNEQSRKKINPYVTTSGDKAFPSGDAFSVYPIENGVVSSLRAVVFRDALADIEICRLLESFIGREKVIEMIDGDAGMDVTFFQYPRNSRYIPELIEKMKQEIKTYTNMRG